jgi:iron complex transport system ATP-binding protein
MTVKYSNQVIIDNISVEFNGGEMVAIIGKNGIGKTTFIKGIANLIHHDGRIRLFEGSKNFSEKDISYLPQLGTANSQLSVFEMILLGLVHDLRWKVQSQQIQRVEEIIESLNLSGIAKKAFNTLSGGQKQLILMAQSFISKPKTLLLDEPTSALDLRHQLVIMDKAREYTQTSGAITIFVVHDLMLAARYSDKMILLHDKKIQMQGVPGEVLLPELLETVYKVEVNVEINSLGQYCIIPQKPL